ncbi:MAG: hypothetical protein NTW25_14395 [Candidatus Kapabacteria bacterium]|nr:hypothetical protein [Candidatus Kapabacteria bacterium]
MLKYFSDVADNINEIKKISYNIYSLLVNDSFDGNLLDKLYADRLVQISYIENWISTDIGKTLVAKYNTEWKKIFEDLKIKDEYLLIKLNSINLSQKVLLKNFQRNKSLLIYSRENIK